MPEMTDRLMSVPTARLEVGPHADPHLVQFNVLGALEIVHGPVHHSPSAPKVLQVLAMLVLSANRIVQIESLIEQLWGDQPPRSALTTLQTYIYQIRRFLERQQIVDDGERLVVTRAPGYVLVVPPEQVDVRRFQRLVEAGRAHLRRREHAAAAEHLRAGLRLWSGNPLENVPSGRILTAKIADLTEQRRTAIHLRIEAEMEMGMHRELIGELRSLATLHPLDEGLYGQLIRALHRSGRRSDALAAYHRLRTNLGEELGLDPCRELRVMHQELLRSA